MVRADLSRRPAGGAGGHPGPDEGWPLSVATLEVRRRKDELWDDRRLGIFLILPSGFFFYVSSARSERSSLAGSSWSWSSASLSASSSQGRASVRRPSPTRVFPNRI